MNKIAQLLLAAFVLFFAGIAVSSCEDDSCWYDEDYLLTDEMHGSLMNHYVVATGNVKDVTMTSATICFSANYNFKKKFGIKPGIRISTSEKDIKEGYYSKSTDDFEDFIAATDFKSSELELKFNNLMPGTTYYYRAVADADGSCCQDYVRSFITPPDFSTLKSVELGLSVKWAEIDLAASTSRGWCNSFDWGETSTSTPKAWYEFSLSTLKNQGYIDAKNNLCPSYDIATQTWGNDWRMPTKNEWQELISKCTWKTVSKNGTDVYLVTGPNGNYIFLPKNDYWSSTASTSKSYYFDYYQTKIEEGFRYFLLYHIRPVRN